MRHSTTSAAAVAALAAIASAADHKVEVGSNGNVFDPAELTVAEGDTISFKIYSGHNVVQSAFSSPCKALSSGFDSGKIFSGAEENPDYFVVTVNDTKPIWAYCAYPGHCQGGMVFAANAPSSGNTFDAYSEAAGNAGRSTGGDAVAGGVYNSKAGGSGSSGSSSSSSSSSGSSSGGSSATGSSASGSASSTPSSSASGGAGGSSSSQSPSSSVSTSPSGTDSAPASTSSTGAAVAVQANQGAATFAVLGLAGLVSWFM